MERQEISMEENPVISETFAIPFGIDQTILVQLEKNRELRQIVEHQLSEDLGMDLNSTGSQKMIAVITGALEAYINESEAAPFFMVDKKETTPPLH